MGRQAGSTQDGHLARLSVLFTGNVAVLPENHGWIADIRRKEDLDYLRYITAELIARQYMRQVGLRRIAGYPVITRSVPGYLAYMQLRAFYGDSSLVNHLKKSHDQYLKGRAGEPNAEPSLLRADEEAIYVSKQKGSYVLCQLGADIGYERVDSAITEFYRQAEGAEADVHDLYALLKLHTPPAEQGQLAEYFEGQAVLHFTSNE